MFGKSDNDKWEYKMECLHPTGGISDTLDNEFQKWGEQGWELISVVPSSRTGQVMYREFYFKRPKSPSY